MDSGDLDSGKTWIPSGLTLEGSHVDLQRSSFEPRRGARHDPVD